MMVPFLRYVVLLIVRPRTAIQALLRDPKRMTYGLCGLLSVPAIYVPGVTLAQARKWYPRADRLVLRIPADRYYVYEAVFLVPVSLAEAIVTAGVMRLAGRMWHGQGRFEDLFALFGFAHFPAVTLAMGVPDLYAGLTAPERPHVRGLPPHVLVGTLWLLALTLLVVKDVERLPWGQSAIIVGTAAATNAGIEFVFVR